MIDLPVLWRSFWHGLRDMLIAVRLMPTWVYLILAALAAVANLLALGVVR